MLSQMQERTMNNVFSGPDALKDFLDPDQSPATPLVELPERLNPYASSRVRIFAKLLYLCPLLNLKFLPVLRMLQNAGDELKDVHTLIESSSGNTAFSIAILGRLFGVERVEAIVPLDIAPGKLELLRLAGVDVRCDTGKIGGVILARRLGRRPWLLQPGSIFESRKCRGACRLDSPTSLGTNQWGTDPLCNGGSATTGTAMGRNPVFSWDQCGRQRPRNLSS